MEIERNKVVNIRNFIEIWEVVKGKNQQNNTLTNFRKGKNFKIARVTKVKTIFAGQEMAFFRKKGFPFSIFFYSVLLFSIPLFLSAYIYIIITLNYPQSTQIRKYFKR